MSSTRDVPEMPAGRPPAATGIVPWNCPTCTQVVLTPYCPRCGEEPHSPHELTLRGLVEKLAHALTSIDARTAHTAWTLLRQPGRLTLSWLDGVRRPYVAPFQLFLLANVIFFALQWATGTNVFSSTLDSHMHHQDWSELARALVAQRLQATHRTLEVFAPLFDRAVVLYAKSLIVLMTLPFALLLPVVFIGRRQPFMAHVVFTMHHYSFLLLLFCLSLLLSEVSALSGGGGLDAPWVDKGLSVLNLLACAAYLYLAIGPVYTAQGWRRVLQATLLSLIVGAIVLGYRFVLFLIALYGT